jgi:RNA polymerase sigma-70 factor (ECF subfamily)
MLMWLVATLVSPTRVSTRVGGNLQADQAALGRAAAGDASGLAALYDGYARPVYSLALRILRDPSDAEDVVQEVFLQAWRQASRYDPSRGAVAAWLLTQARSRAIDRLRARRARPAPADVGSSSHDVVDPSPALDWQVLSAEQVTLVRAAIDELPVLQRVAIELAYYEGWTQMEIAERLEQPLGTVKTRIRLAMAKLREALAGTR